MFRISAAVFAASATFLSGACAAPPMHFIIERPTDLNSPRANRLTPAVHATLGGVKGRFVLDTGAAGTIVSDRFAAQIAIAGSASASAVDSTNERIKGAVLRNVPVLLGDVQRMAQVVAVPLGPLGELGFDGIMSPHALAGDGCAVLDFAHGEGWVAEEGDPLCDPAAQPSVPLGANRGKLPTVMVLDADSERHATFVVDSGAAQTSVSLGFSRSAPVLRSGNTRGIAGKPQDTEVIGPVCLRIGAHAAPLAEAERPIVRAQPNLGFDILQDARVVMRANGSGFIVLPPTAGPCVSKEENGE